MTNLGIPVPPGFTITTEACRYFYENDGKIPPELEPQVRYFYENDGKIPPELEPQVREAMSRIESLMGRKFGDPNNPLLVSVRSGAPVSMPIRYLYRYDRVHRCRCLV